MKVASSVFRRYALLGGAIVLGLCSYIATPYGIAITVGLLFGSAGLLIDYFAVGRFEGVQVSGWALAAGGALLVLIARSREFLFSDGYWGWTIIGQYTASAVLAWGLLMYILPPTGRSRG